MPTQKPRRRRPVPLLLHHFTDTGRLRIPGTAYGGPTQHVRIVVLIQRATGWVPCPFVWMAWRDDDTGDLLIDLAFDCAEGLVVLYAAPAPRTRKRTP